MTKETKLRTILDQLMNDAVAIEFNRTWQRDEATNRYTRGEINFSTYYQRAMEINAHAVEKTDKSITNTINKIYEIMEGKNNG